MSALALRIAASALLAAVLGVSACKKAEQAKAPPPPPPVPVVVAKAEQRDMPVLLRSVGNVESIAAVTLRPQVGGQLLETPIAEGTPVKAGDVVARIDPRPFEAALREAEASLAKNQALAADERRAAQQLRTALSGRAVSIREVEAAEAKAASAEAQVGQDQAAIETAKLNLSYCTIAAPFAGRLGAYHVKPGAVLKANETDLVDVTQLAPIDVAFSVREQDMPALRSAIIAGPVPVEVSIENDPSPAKGTLNFFDNRVDPNTGALRVKARFDNADRRLWPGQFVNVVLTVSVDKGVVVVPSMAVQASQRGQSVFVIKPDNTAEFRQVQVRRSTDGETIVQSGVQVGETVVTDGQLRLTNGAAVTPRGAEAKQPPKDAAQAKAPGEGA